MAQMTSSKWQSIIELIYNANAHLEELPAFRRQVLAALQKTIRADNANFFLVDDRLRPIDAIGLNLPEKYLQLYQKHFFRLNPFDPSHVRIPIQNALVDTSLYQFSDFKKTYYFNDFLKPQEVRRQMVLYLKSKQKLLGFIGLHRADEKEAFKRWELAVAETIAPMLSQSLEKAQAFERSRVKENLFQAIINRNHTGALVVNFNMEVLFINETAGHLFKQINAAGIPFTQLHHSDQAVPSQVYGLVMDLIARHKTIKPGSADFKARRSLALTGSRALAIGVEMICSQMRANVDPFVLITVAECALQGEPINESRLIRDYGFTKREMEIVHLIFKGLKNSEIAGLLFITEGTVKNHIKNIYSKIGVTTRTSLIHDILNY